ncbi:unnamed protein product, partial [Mesorhabditis belari]|uniref:Sugar phosphate exchanger 3 n=1 Tax=Mesorhabditis belari TaxID=2138241 RepID=A0AAF3FEX2_9BILA
MPRSVVRVRRSSSTDPLSPPTLLARIWHFFTGNERWTSYHISVFFITFFSFAFIHATRKTLSTVKSSMIHVWVVNSSDSSLFPTKQAAEEFLAFLDFGFLVAYAVGLFFGGILGDRYNPRIVLSIGMWLSATTAFFFGFMTEQYHIYNKVLYAILWISGGLFQSVAWPTEVCIMGNWFGHASRGIVMGLWSGCASVGNIIGTIITSQVVPLGYQWAFAVNSSILFFFAFVVFWHLVPAPRLVGLPEPTETPDERNRVIEESSERPKPISFWRAWFLPGVIPFSLSYACLKMVNYGFFFWLPMYLQTLKMSEADADKLSMWYDVGGIISAIVAGAVSDHYKSRTPIVVGMLVCGIFSLWGYSKSPPDFYINGCMLAIAGFFVGGPANMISGAISADLGKAREIRGNAEALSTVTGIVDGTGSVGAALGQLLIPSVELWFGWTFIFYGFIIMLILTIVCILPLFMREVRAWHTARNERNTNSEQEGLLQEDNNYEGNHEHLA